MLMSKLYNVDIKEYCQYLLWKHSCRHVVVFPQKRARLIFIRLRLLNKIFGPVLSLSEKPATLQWHSHCKVAFFFMSTVCKSYNFKVPTIHLICKCCVLSAFVSCLIVLDIACVGVWMTNEPQYYIL